MMRIDYTGQKFNMLTAIKFLGVNKKYRLALWEFKCDCGSSNILPISIVKRKKVKSCGCLKKISPNFIHGKTKSRAFKVWQGIKSRCLCKANPAYKRYGGRGITVSKRWNKFKTFYKDMGDPPSSKHSIDRINNSKGYSKQNCRWATAAQQAENTKNNINYTINKITKCLKAWCIQYKINYKTVWWRVSHGKWDIIKALTTPTNKYHKNIK